MIDENELNNWITTESGLNWLNSQKQGLINKNNELLAEIKKSNGQLTDAILKSNALEEQNKSFKDDITKRIINEAYNTSGISLMDGTQELVRRMIYLNAESKNGLNLKINDDKSISLEDSDGKSFQNYFVEWSKTKESYPFQRNGISGGGGAPNADQPIGTYNTQKRISEMSTQEVAKNWNKPEFRNDLNKILN